MDQEQQQELQDALQDLYNDLGTAYWVATTTEGKDLISGCAHAIYDILTQMSQQTFAAATPQFVKLKGDVDAVNKKLTQLKEQIDNIIHKIDTATQVLTSIAKVINIAMPLFA